MTGGGSTRAEPIDGGRSALPAFDVRARGREARLSLARPIEAPMATWHRLELSYPLGSTLDFRAGAASFRHRAGTAPSGEIAVGFDWLLREAAERGVSLRLDAEAGSLRVVIDLGSGPVPLEGRVEARGGDLFLCPSSHASDDALRASGAALGFDVEEDGLVFRRGFRRLLVASLAWHGWRAPSVEVPVEARARATGLRFAWGDSAGESRD